MFIFFCSTLYYSALYDDNDCCFTTPRHPIGNLHSTRAQRAVRTAQMLFV
uniref:Uncharacterized protein n=1 Tax=Anguilla anguilla TaxID=7936 RepID=A0A0E9WC04_ANGAN